MDTKQFHRRVWGMVLMLALILGGLGYTLYDTQVLQGERYYRQSQNNIAETETVEASRGIMTDRYGRVLVSNRVVYQVTLNTSQMGKTTAQRNQTIASLLQVARQAGVEWNDTLPISTEEPFRFLTPSPYFTVTQKEDGSQTRTLTQLGKLCVDRKWIEDPTKEPEPEEEPAPAPVQKEGLLDKLKRFFTGEEAEPAVPAQTKQKESTHLPTATELLGLMCSSFDIQGEGAVDPKDPQGQQVPTLNIGDMDAEEARAVAGVLYELYLRSRGVYWAPYIFAEDVDIRFISLVKEQGLDGVVVEATTVRQYNTNYAAHLLGRVGLMTSQEEWNYYNGLNQGYEMDDTVGREGAELAFESYLRGTAGTRTVERNTNGKIVGSEWQTEPEPGDNIVLTIDLGLQEAVENILASALPNLASEEVEGAACVVLDVNTAEVLASASYPTYSLATYGADIGKNSSDPLKPLYNRALRGTYAPGSTFKMVTAIAGLEEGIIAPKTVIRDEGRYTYYDNNGPQCWIYRQQGRTHGPQTVDQAIENSCNYFFFDVGRQLGIAVLDEYAAKFGLGERTGIELGEEAGVMASPAYTEAMGGTWYDGNTLSVAIGQESSQFTPLQLANYIATLVNGGTRNQVHLLKEVKSSDFSQVLYTQQPEVLGTVDIAPQNLEAVKKGMLALTTNSLARYFRDLPVQVGAKTGSAQISAQTESNAVFVCFAPYDNPQVALAIVVEHGGSGSELGAMAADILSYYFSAQQTREEILVENTLIR